MDDISREAVSSLLVIAIILTVTFTWLLLDKEDDITIIQLNSYKSQPTGSGDVRLEISTESASSRLPSRSSDLTLEIQKRG